MAQVQINLDESLFNKKPVGMTKKEYIKRLIEKHNSRHKKFEEKYEAFKESNYTIIVSAQNIGCRDCGYMEDYAIFTILELAEGKQEMIKQLNTLFEGNPHTIANNYHEISRSNLSV